MKTKSEKDNITISLRLDNKNYGCRFLLEDFVDDDVLFPLEVIIFNQLRSLIQMVCCKYTGFEISSLQKQFNKDNKANDATINQIRKEGENKKKPK